MEQKKKRVIWFSVFSQIGTHSFGFEKESTENIFCNTCYKDVGEFEQICTKILTIVVTIQILHFTLISCTIKVSSFRQAMNNTHLFFEVFSMLLQQLNLKERQEKQPKTKTNRQVIGMPLSTKSSVRSRIRTLPIRKNGSIKNQPQTDSYKI